MATQKLFIIDNPNEESDGVVQNPDKENIGLAWQKEAPNGHFIVLKLDSHWIITDEEYKNLKCLKKN